VASAAAVKGDSVRGRKEYFKLKIMFCFKNNLIIAPNNRIISQ